MKKAKAVYKVVEKRTRKSAIVSGAGNVSDPELIKKYCRVYKKGTIVRSVRGSLGIFCFEDLEDAQDFKGNCDASTMIVKVRPIGKRLKEVEFIANFAFDMRTVQQYYDLFHSGKPMRKIQRARWDVPIGTVRYNSVEVLE